jgi:co-chaperonin GroES (HSP10)
MLIVKSVKPGPGRVILEPYVGTEETETMNKKSGIYHLQAGSELLCRVLKGKVVAVGTQIKAEDPQPCQVGDWVAIGKNTQVSFIVDGVEYWETFWSNIKAVLTVEEITDEEYEAKMAELRHMQDEAEKIRKGVSKTNDVQEAAPQNPA